MTKMAAKLVWAGRYLGPSSCAVRLSRPIHQESGFLSARICKGHWPAPRPWQHSDEVCQKEGASILGAGRHLLLGGGGGGGEQLLDFFLSKAN